MQPVSDVTQMSSETQQNVTGSHNVTESYITAQRPLAYSILNQRKAGCPDAIIQDSMVRPT